MSLPLQFASAFDGDNPASSPCTPRQRISIACYDNTVPAFAAAEIDRLYGHLLSSLSHFMVARDLEGASTYVATQGGTPIAVFLFRREGREVNVISEFITLDQEAVQLFTGYMFARHPELRRIAFNKVRADLQGLPYPFQAVNCTEDVVVDLPDTVEEYGARLGKSTRRNIKRYTSTLQKEFPSYRYQLYVEEEISEQLIRDIVRLNRTRMADKSIVSRIDEEETRWIVDFAKRCGMVGVATIDGRVCCGAIGFRIGQDYFMHVIAHDPQYNDYSLGFLCYYLTICEGIVRRGKRFHLLLGRYEYKYRLLGVTQEFACVDVYRNRWACLRYGARIGRTAYRAAMLKSRLWLLEAERRSDPTSRRVARVVEAARKIKRNGLRALLFRKPA
jgi:hypothetical protein